MNFLCLCIFVWVYYCHFSYRFLYFPLERFLYSSLNVIDQWLEIESLHPVWAGAEPSYPWHSVGLGQHGALRVGPAYLQCFFNGWTSLSSPHCSREIAIYFLFSCLLNDCTWSQYQRWLKVKKQLLLIQEPFLALVCSAKQTSFYVLYIHDCIYTFFTCPLVWFETIWVCVYRCVLFMNVYK